jgi:hypothetical protein
MTDRDSLTVYSKKDFDNARTKAQVVGWLQGAGAVLIFGVVVNLIGWIPMIAIGAVALFVLYRVLFGGRS